MTEVQKLKRIPYGKVDFNDFREKNLYYVDKTRFIRDIEEKGDFLFLIRPRRFGKSLFLGILEAYYDIAYKDRFDDLFVGTDIHRSPTKEKNSYMILKLNFSMVNADSSRAEDAFTNYIKDYTYRFFTKYEKIIDIDLKTAKEELFAKKSAAEVMVTFLSLCPVKKYRLYVIIDEYDNFANTILSESGETEFERITHGEGFFRAFFNVLKGGTTDLESPISRLFITGVSPITLDDVTSGFNIAEHISRDSDLNEIMGFTRSEVETMIEYYRQTGKIRHSTPELLEIMGQWYSHYRFSVYAPGEVFNTVHVLYFLKEYMKESLVPDTLIDYNARIDYMKLRHLIIIDQKGTLRTNGNFSVLRKIIAEGSTHSTIIKSFPIAELTNPKNFISLLYYFGLLTIQGMDEENTPVLTIPNEMVKRLYYSYITDTYEETSALHLDMMTYTDLMKDMAYRGNWQALVEYIAGRMEASLSIRDLMTGEKAHQVFWNVYLGLADLYIVYSEKEMEKGYADLVMEPFLAQYPQIKYSYLIEIKYLPLAETKKAPSPAKLKAARKEAEDQLRQYSLDEKFQKVIRQTTLKKVLLIFSGARLVYYDEVAL